MALIAMAVYSTEENKKDECLEKTIESLRHECFGKHRLILSVNAYTSRTKVIIQKHSTTFASSITSNTISRVIYNSGNVGTAKAVNKAWALRKPGEHCVKMDDDIIVHHDGWVDEMEAAIESDPLIGQVGLKRKDLIEHPKHPDADYKSELIMLPHIPGHPWRIVEKVKHCIGSCVMHSSALLDKVGYLYQPGQYGYDDVIMSHRTHLAGFYSCFLPHINIDHIDPGDTPFQSWKEKHAGEHTQEMIEYVKGMYAGTKPIYHKL